MESTGNLHGVHKSLHRVHGESSWSPHGVHEIQLEESPWSPCGLVDSTGTPHGLSMESMWTVGKAECSPAKIHGVSTKSSWTPWRVMESPHGVPMNVWGSVKYSYFGQGRY